MKLNPRDISNALKARGIALGSPIGEPQLRRLEGELQIVVDAYLKQMFREFNGFESYYDRNHICLWSAERIVNEKEMSVVVDGERYFAVGDLLVDSDFVMCCLERMNAPVFLLYEERRLSSTVDGFFEKFISGDFDLSVEVRV